MTLVLGRSVSLILPGLVAGMVGALFLTRTIRGLLFGIEPLDRPTLALVCLVFAGVGAIASWLPASRAARVDPIIAMRSECAGRDTVSPEAPMVPVGHWHFDRPAHSHVVASPIGAAPGSHRDGL